MTNTNFRTSSLTSTVSVFISVVLLTYATLAQPGTLDRTLNGVGFVKANFGSGPDEAITSSVLQPDGKFVVASSSGFGQETDFSVRRYNPDGSLDPSFNRNGKLLLPVGPGSDQAFDVALQLDGKIVVAGRSFYSIFTGGIENWRSKMSVVRLNSDGTIDNSFSEDGMSFVEFGSIFASAYALAIQSDGKIVLVGSCRCNGADIALVRLNPDGSPDLGFGENGKLILNSFPAGSASDIAIQNDGKLIIAGNTGQGTSNSNFAVIRLLNDGSFDLTFNGSGIAVVDFHVSGSYAETIAIQSDGKILAAGHFGGSVGIIRLNPNGTLDATFSSDGAAIRDFMNDSGTRYTMSLRPDGRILITSSGLVASRDEVKVASFTPDGEFDNSFNGNGMLSFYVGSGDDVGTSAVLQADGKLIVSGNTESGFMSDYSDFITARINPNGTLDSSFGFNGTITTNVGSRTGSGHSIAIQKDQKIVVAGTVYESTNVSEAVVVRFNPDGTLDESFNGTGRAEVFRRPELRELQDVKILPDGRILVAGYSKKPASQIEFFLARYNTDGALDSSFGNRGIRSFSVGPGDDSASRIVIQTDGKIVVAGNSRRPGTGDDYDLILVRLNENGSIDRTFGSSGILNLTELNIANPRSIDLAIQSDGQILVLGGSIQIPYSTIIARFNEDGSLDTYFGNNGIVLVDSNISLWENRLSLTDDGSIFVAGALNSIYRTGFIVFKFNGQGRLDNSFNRTGRSFKEIRSKYLNLSGMAVYPDGKIVLGGFSEVPLGTDNLVTRGHDYVVTRFNGDGRIDSNWGDDGIAYGGFGKYSLAYDLAIDEIGRVVLTGVIGGGLSLARFNGDNNPGKLNTENLLQPDDIKFLSETPKVRKFWRF